MIKIRSCGCRAGRAILLVALPCAWAPAAQQPDVQDIIQKSVAANKANFNAAPQFNWKERDHDGKDLKTYQVTMIEGTPYQRLLAINGKPLSHAQEKEELRKQEQSAAQRRAESPEERRKRIDKFEKDRTRDNRMMQELTKAFNFTYIGHSKLRGFSVWMLKATPRPGYNPPNMETQVLPGMEGELWIDQKTDNWVRVTARVIHPVSIEGFLAQVEPGTRFEMEMSPVGGGIWQISHFSMKSNAKVLYMFNRSSQEDDTYYDYQRVGAGPS